MAGNTPATPVLRTVGATARDHANATAWDGAVGSPGSDDTIEIGEFYADADFLDNDLLLGSWTTTNFHNVIMRAAPGHEWSGIDGEAGKVRFKPTTGTFIMQKNATTNNEGEMHGFEFDGSGVGFTGRVTFGLVHLRSNNWKTSRCSFHHNPLGAGLSHDPDFAFNTVVNCAMAHNGGDGYRDHQSASQATLFLFCVFYKNAGWGMARNVNNQQDRAFNCAFFENTLGSVQFPENAQGGWCIMDDQSITDSGFNWLEIIENATLWYSVI